MAITIDIIIDNIRQTVTIEISGHRGGIRRIGTGQQFMIVADTIAVAVRIAVITNAISVKIKPFGRISGKDIHRIADGVAIKVAIEGVRNTITIEVEWHARRIHRVKAQRAFVFVIDAIVILIGIAVIAETIAVKVGPL